MPVETIKYSNNKVSLIDQRYLPGKLKYISISDEKEMFDAIKKMKIRGAPAIGVAGAFGMYLGIKKIKAKNFGMFYRKLKQIEKYIASSRPTARNLFWALERIRKIALRNKTKPICSLKELVLEESLNILKEDNIICKKIGQHGNRLIRNNDRILTHCNAGGLATARFGTALSPIFTAKKMAKNIHVYVDETRPVLQGARLTAWELLKEGIKNTLICDNMSGMLMSKGMIDKIIVGADRIALNGDVANKIGTYNLAIIARFHGIPFYVAAPLSTFDFSIKTGKGIVIEERNPDEVRRISGTYIAPKKVKVYNPSFDVTPNRLVTAIITEKGILRPPFNKTVPSLRDLRSSAKLALSAGR